MNVFTVNPSTVIVADTIESATAHAVRMGIEIENPREAEDGERFVQARSLDARDLILASNLTDHDIPAVLDVVPALSRPGSNGKPGVIPPYYDPRKDGDCQYRARAERVEAYQLHTGHDPAGRPSWLPQFTARVRQGTGDDRAKFFITTSGPGRVDLFCFSGDWIVRRSDGHPWTVMTDVEFRDRFEPYPTPETEPGKFVAEMIARESELKSRNEAKMREEQSRRDEAVFGPRQTPEAIKANEDVAKINKLADQLAETCESMAKMGEAMDKVESVISKIKAAEAPPEANPTYPGGLLGATRDQSAEFDRAAEKTAPEPEDKPEPVGGWGAGI